MAKYGYRCACGWQLKRGDSTRKQYAEHKRKHAEKCEALAKELEVSRGVASK